MRDFHSRERICTHVVSSSRKCAMFYRNNGTQLSEQALEAAEEEAYRKTKSLITKGKRRTYAENQAPLRLFGPLHPNAAELGVRHDCLLTVPPKTRR